MSESEAKPGTRTGQRSRPMTWTTAAAIPTGTAIRIARLVDIRPTPIAMGASSAAESASTRNHPLTALSFSLNEARILPAGSSSTSG